MTDTQPANGKPLDLLSETARVHIEGVEKLVAENRDLRTLTSELEFKLHAETARASFAVEALALTQRQSHFYQNFGLTLLGKLDAIQAIIHDAVAIAQTIGDKPQPLTAADEARLAELTQSLEPHATEELKHNG